MDDNLNGKRAIVCGASKGIGCAIAKELARQGASVTLLARNEDALLSVKDSLKLGKGQSHYILCADLSNPETLKEKIGSYLDKKPPMHILVNNSGGPPAGPVSTAAPEAFYSAFTQHLIANHIMMQAIIEGMKSEQYGRIINIISTSVKIPLKGLGVSNTIRGAVASWAKTLSGELAEFGITVNNVLPGATDTDRLAEIMQGKAAKTGLTLDETIQIEQSHIPAGRFALPEEIAVAVAFLASPAAGYINGINIPVDGGRTGCL